MPEAAAARKNPPDISTIFSIRMIVLGTPLADFTRVNTSFSRIWLMILVMMMESQITNMKIRMLPRLISTAPILIPSDRTPLPHW